MPRKKRLAACLDEGSTTSSPSSGVTHVTCSTRRARRYASVLRRSVRRMTRRGPWTAAWNISQVPRAGKRAATCAAWWRQCRSFLWWWMPSAVTPVVAAERNGGWTRTLPRLLPSARQALGSALAFLRATRPSFIPGIGSFYCGRARPTPFISITCSMSAGRMRLTACSETRPSSLGGRGPSGIRATSGRRRGDRHVANQRVHRSLSIVYAGSRCRRRH